MSKSGVEWIAERRQVQFTKGYGNAHDDEHDFMELVYAAVAYALPGEAWIYEEAVNPKRGNMLFLDPYPWDDRDSRARAIFHGENFLVKLKDLYYVADKIEALANAGSLLAAAIDRLQREEEKKG